MWGPIIGAIGNVVSGAIGLGQHIYDDKNGITAAAQAQQLKLEQEKANSRIKMLIIAGIVIMIIVIIVIVLKPKRNG